MLKQMGIVLALTSIYLAGCSHEDAATDKKAGEKHEESAQPVTTEKSSTDQKEDSESANGSPVKAEQNDSHDASLSQEKVIKDAKEQIKGSISPKLPIHLPLSSEDKNLSAATLSESDMYRVIFFESEKMIPVNSKELNNSTIAKPIAVIEVHQYKTEEEAKSKIGYIQPEGIQAGNPIDLGHSIQGYEDAGAGHKWLNWHEGRWYLQVQASNIEGNSDYVPLAKQMVSYLESNQLPVPHEYGSVKADIDSQKADNNRISWQEGTVVYTVSEVADPIDMLAIACNFDETKE